MACRATRLSDKPPLEFDQALPIAFVAVLTAGFVGGALGSRIVRRSPVAGLLLAILVAWPVAITTLPIVPRLRGDSFLVAQVCFFDSCMTEISDGDPWSGL